MSAINEFKKLLAEAQKKHEDVLKEAISGQTTSDTSIPTKAAEYLSKSRSNDNIPASPENVEKQRWNDPLRREPNEKFVTFKEMNDHYGLFLQRIQQQMSTIGGSGEVNLRYLDDINRATMTPNNDNWVLEYDATTKKAQFTNRVGPIDTLNFDLSHTHDEERVVGTLCWSPEDQTINIEHPGGVTQQVGQESYAYVRNGTANTIPNGTPVMFAGAEPDSASGARLLVSPMVADGTFPSLYGLGITTQDLDPQQDGRVTVWGKVRDLDTSAWDVGDILYADPSNVGQLTNVKPTAPNNVTPMAAVLKKDATEGEIFVRPTINQMMYYGRFSRTTDVTVPNPNQAYAVPFNATDISNGIVFNGGTDTQIIVPESGFYQFDVNAQVTATSNKGLVYFWFRKNGVDIPRSSHISTITNGDTFNISTTIQVSLNVNEYIELMWARTADGILLDAKAATAFAPSTSAVTMNVVQVQL